MTNNSTAVPAQNATITLTTAPGTTFVSITPPAGWTCGTTPAVGGTGSIVCTATNPMAPSSGSGNFTLVLDTNPTLANGSTVTQSVTTSTSSPETNTANNTASTNTAVIRRVDVAVTKVTNNPGPDNAFQQGETLIYTITVTNNGPSLATNVVLSDPLPSGFAFTSVVPGSPTCTQSSGTVTCTYASMNPGATNNIVVTGTITVNRTQLSNTATSTRTEVDTNPPNDSATALANVLAPTAIRMFDTNLEQDGDGNVRIEWTTSFEVDNLGFNLYRETSGGRVKVNPSLIPGSALFAAKRQLDSGRSYAWKDTVGQGEFAQYTIEDLDLNGQRTLHGPFTPILVGSVTPRAISSASFESEAQVATQSESGGIFVSPRGMGAPIYPSLVPGKKQKDQQLELAQQANLKLQVKEEGWYRVTKSQLVAAGIRNTSKLALFTGGVEQAMIVTDDAIEFYGIGLDTPGTGLRTYWLSNGAGTGLRITKATTGKGLVGKGQAAARTPFTFERIERTVFFTALTNNGDRENFFGAIVTGSPVTRDLTVEKPRPHRSRRLAGDRPAGRQRGRSRRARGHQRNRSRHGADQRDAAQSGQAHRSAQSPQRRSEQPAPDCAERDTDISVVESLRLTHPHRLVADDNALKVSVTGGSSVSVSGFTGTRARALDITDPVQPIELTVLLVDGTASFVAPQLGTRTIFVIGDSRLLAPVQITNSRSTNWNNKKNSADLVVLTNAMFTASAQSLKARRDGEGVATTIIDVQDLYDEFNFGDHGPDAIREFLLKTKDWRRAPKYVLLLGDASMDPRNYLGLGSYDFVPRSSSARNT